MGLDLSLTKSEQILKSTTRDFLSREISRDSLQALLDSETGYTETIRKKVADIGWFGIIIPESLGGIGYPLTSAGVLFEALGSLPLPGPYFSSGILGSLIVMEAGDDSRQKALLPGVADGSIRLSLALTEPAYGWGPESINASASPEGGWYSLNGTKLFVMDARAATHFIVAVRTGDKTADPGEGISLFLVDKELGGVSIAPLTGYFSARTFEVKFDNVMLSEDNLLGEPNRCWPTLARAIEKAIPVLCAYKVGGCQAVFTMALDYSRQREQFGQPIGRFQRVQDMIIEMVNYADAARWTTYEALWKLDSGIPPGESIHLAKAVASEAYWQACTLAHRVFSGISYSMEHDVSFHTRASRSLYHFLGDPAYHRQQLTLKLMA
ncbi:MAG: acyl-CoA/acyl-ACP dehydrogenase [Proteobacteria bacterium]|nr:acyl-CoA/acyl-ACP dehydrogenase [Pseudomonadota bacterium]MBU4471260.1 acyl-CoA/acyl-ACP dehydrogenase [Pseudomonadota bacterium]MCG2751710.1 acyl-CoA/acyl-ACP dehydrogenase [Desulfobacteraceae bacterium]